MTVISEVDEKRIAAQDFTFCSSLATVAAMVHTTLLRETTVPRSAAGAGAPRRRPRGTA